MPALLNTIDAAFADDGSLWLSVNVYRLLPCLLAAVVLRRCLRATKGTLMSIFSIFVVLFASIVIAALCQLPLPRRGPAIRAAMYRVNLPVLNSSRASWNYIPRGDSIFTAADKLALSYRLSVKDEATDDFISDWIEHSQSLRGRMEMYVKDHTSTFLQQQLGWSMPDAAGAINKSTQFVASSSQLSNILQHAKQRGLYHNLEFGSLLDIGAGDGAVTDILSSTLRVSASNVTAVEKASSLRRSLAARGYRAVASLEGVDRLHLFDAIALLNVLDRSDAPASLLEAAVSRLKPGGVLFVATVLPFCGEVSEGRVGKVRAWRPPTLPLRLHSAGSCTAKASFELSASVFVEAVFDRRNLEVIAWTRLPYISSGDPKVTHGYLDAAIFLVRRSTDPARTEQTNNPNDKPGLS